MILLQLDSEVVVFVIMTRIVSNYFPSLPYVIII